MSKKFDCVEMKHKASRIIQKKLSGLSREEELAYWKKQSKKLKEEQNRLTGGGK
jgi:hypothetical protein